MKKIKLLLSFLLLLFTVSLHSQNAEYNEEALIADGYRTGSDLNIDGNSVLSNGGEVDKNGSNKYCGDIFIPEGITTLEKSGDGAGEGSFQYSYITTATLPSSVTTIETAAFADCIYLSNIYIDDDNEKYFDHDGVVYEWLKKDESDPFNPEKNEFQLVAVPGAKINVTILEGTTSIGPCALDGCSEITAVVIPATVTAIHQYAFTGTKLTSLTCMGTTPPVVYGKFDDWGWWDRNTTSHGLYNLGVEVIKVPFGCIDEYSNANRWDDYAGKITQMPEVEETPQVTYVQHVEKIILRDSENYTRAEAHTIGDEIRREENEEGLNTTIDIYYSSAATYERTFKNDKWQALYAPFVIKYRDYRTDLLEVAKIKRVTEYVDADNNITFFYLTAEVLDEGDEIPAHTPCVVRSIVANEAGVGRDIDLFKGVDSNTEPRVLEPAQTSTMVLTSSNGNQYNLVGQYTKRTTGEIRNEDYIDDKDIYAMSGGALKKAGNNNVTLGAYRWYLTIEPSQANAAMVFKFGKFQNSGTTTIENVIVDVVYEDEKYYDLSGRAVENPQRGIYIRNGKKIYYNK
ncbi:MAG: leucine-rich repeat domain-containing protein [Bacteroidaceae bacterium]|nr:leucine-rich repeat domain-containing protein [Bacteroidaceae bacterium]